VSRVEKVTKALRCAEILEAAEVVQQVVVAHPPLALRSWWRVAGLTPRTMVVKTDRRTLIVEASGPDQVTPLSTSREATGQNFGPIGDGGIGKVLPTEDLWVSSKDFAAVRQMAGSSDPTAGWTKRLAQPAGVSARMTNMLLVAALPFLVMGVHDFLGAGNQEYQLFGLFFAVVGLLGVAASYIGTTLKFGIEVARDLMRASMVGSLLAALAFTPHVFGGVVEGGIWLRLAGWLLLASAALGAAASVAWLKFIPPTVDTERNRNGGWLARLPAFGIQAALLFSVFQWWYTNSYEPTTHEAVISVTAEVKEAAPPAPMHLDRAFEITVTVKNNGDKTQIIDSAYNLEARGVHGHLRESDEIPMMGALAGQTLPSLSTPEVPGDVVESGTLFSDGWFFSKGEEVTTTFVVLVRADRISKADVMRVSVELAMAKGQRLALDGGPIPVENLGTRFRGHRWSLRSLGWYRTIVAGRHSVTSIIDGGGPGLGDGPVVDPRIYVCIDTSSANVNCSTLTRRQKQLTKFYGVATTAGSAEVPINRAPPSG
jgi:hypothetical protein